MFHSQPNVLAYRGRGAAPQSSGRSSGHSWATRRSSCSRRWTSSSLASLRTPLRVRRIPEMVSSFNILTF